MPDLSTFSSLKWPIHTDEANHKASTKFKHGSLYGFFYPSEVGPAKQKKRIYKNVIYWGIQSHFFHDPTVMIQIQLNLVYVKASGTSFEWFRTLELGTMQRSETT